MGPGDPATELTPTAAAVVAAVPAWWAAQVTVAGLDGRWLDVGYALDAEAPVSSGRDEALEVQWAGVSPEDLGAAYVGALSPAVRSRHGRHYTPRHLAEQLWTMARVPLGHKRGKSAALDGLVRDPACGAGALLLPVLREHLAASHGMDPRVALTGLPNLIEGVDTDPTAVWLANVALAAEMLPLLTRVPAKRRKPLPKLARIGDGLAPTHQPAKLIVMNPPFGRVKLSPEDRSTFKHVLYGHANLYSLFMAAALGTLAPSGVIAAVVPTSFLAGSYFKNLREVLGQEMSLREIAFVASRNGVFDSVLQETCLGVFTRKKARRTSITRIDARSSEPVAVVQTSQRSTPWLLPRQASDAPVAAAAATMPLTLEDTGWWASTGPLVWNRRKDDLGPNQPADGGYVVWAADLDGGVLHRDPSRDARRYLAFNLPSDPKVMVLNEPAILVQRTTAPEQQRRLVAAELTAAFLCKHDGRVVVENHVNVLRPWFPAPLVSRELLMKLLATPTLERLVRCISGSVALSAYELACLPMPDRQVLASWEALETDELVAAVAAAYRPVV